MVAAHPFLLLLQLLEVKAALAKSIKNLQRVESELARMASADMSSEVFQNHYLDYEESDWPPHLEGMSVSEDHSVAASALALSSPVWEGHFYYANSLLSSSSSPPDWDLTTVTLAGTDQPWAPSPKLQGCIASPTDMVSNDDTSHPSTPDFSFNSISSYPPTFVESYPAADCEKGMLVAERLSRRKRQNRASQRRFRANKEAKIKDFQERIRLLEAHLDIQRQRNFVLEQEWSRMKLDIERLSQPFNCTCTTVV